MERNSGRAKRAATAVGPFLEAAEAEYDALTGLCDAYASLTHAAASKSAHAPLLPSSEGSGTRRAGRASGVDGDGDLSSSLDRLCGAYSRAVEITRSVGSYDSSVDEVRAARRRLLDAIPPDTDGGCPGVGRRDRAARSPARLLPDLMRRHFDLSGRAIRTCSRSSCGGVIHPNGLLVQETDEGAHEARVVALAAIRASIFNLRRDAERLENLPS